MILQGYTTMLDILNVGSDFWTPLHVVGMERYFVQLNELVWYLTVGSP